MINLYRGWLKWSMQTPTELNEEIVIWAKAFDDYGIGVENYLALITRARDLRISRLSNGLDCPQYNAELVIACWIGENGLKAELDRQRIESGQLLAASSESDCARCHGKGKEFVYDDHTRRVIGVRRGQCDHRPVTEADGLWTEMRSRIQQRAA